MLCRLSILLKDRDEIVSYLLLSHERPGSAVDILCPFEVATVYHSVIENDFVWIMASLRLTNLSPMSRKFLKGHV